MIRNYIKIAWRNLRKNKIFSFINILGLSMGLACFVMIGMYVMDEISYDKYNEKAGRIYRINSDLRLGGTDLNMAFSSDPMGPILKQDYPQVEEFVRFYGSNDSKLIKNKEQYIKENRVTHVDSTLFNVFTFPVIAGDPKVALNSPNTVVITESTAKRYFGNANDALGETIETNDNGSTLYKVTAVIKDIPHNSHFSFDFFFSMGNVEYSFGQFLANNFHTYILLKPGVDYKTFNKNFVEVIDKYIVPQAKQFMQIKSMEEFVKAGNNMEYSLIPVIDIHLHSSRSGELDTNGSIQYVYIFSGVALFILLIACINFMNLSTAQSSGRAKEVGIRKVLGTTKQSLIGQFLSESILMSCIALILALALVWLALPWFNTISGKEMTIGSEFNSWYFIAILSLPFVVGLLAGIYPAFFLSSFNPIKVLKGKQNTGFKNNIFRNFLVVFQFSASIILIIGTIIIYKQLNFIQTSRLGFDKDQVLIVDNSGMSKNISNAIKNEVEKMNGIKSASFGGYLPVGNSTRSDNTFSKETVMNENNALDMQTWNIDYEYIPTLGMEMAKGRNFSPAFGSDSTAIIINETAAKLMGFDDPIGKKLYLPRGEGSTSSYTIIGVVKNFNFESLRQNIGALSFQLGNNNWVSTYRMATTDLKGLVTDIESKYKEMAPGMPFNYQFMDEAFDSMYRQEQRIGKVTLSFSVLAILIACLGLFGLATYMAEQRTKEIGIRKVLGASVSNIVTMLSTDFIKLVLISFVIAIPIAWLGMSKWLQEFAYKINIGWWIFLVAGSVAMLIALITVSFQAIKAAIANPVKSLRTE